MEQILKVSFKNEGNSTLFINHTIDNGRIVIDFADHGNDFLMLKEALIAQNILTTEQIIDLIDAQRTMRELTRDNSDIRQNSLMITPGSSFSIKRTRKHNGELE